MTPGRLWWHIRREWHRGSSAAWHEYVVGPRIKSWRNPYAHLPPQDVPLHVVLGREHVAMAAWMLASWTMTTSRNWNIILHDDGTLPSDPVPITALGLKVAIVRRSLADEQMSEALASRPRCREYRTRYPLGLKIFDVPQMSPAPRLLLFDPDVLFFARPAEIMAWVDGPAEATCWFNEDIAEASNVSAAEAQARLGVALWPRVNSGLCLLWRAALDLDFCESALTATRLSDGHFWRVEQTLFALCASRHNAGGLLPSHYEVSLKPARAAGCVTRHYVGAVRSRFWAEGVRACKILL